MTGRLAAFFRRRFRAILLLAMLLLTLLAWSNRFIQDDAFISFRYAENLVQGKGLVYNEGQRVEGYTNFLWTMMIAAGLWLSIDPVLCSQVLGLIFFVLSLFFTYRLSCLVFGAREGGLLAIVLLGTNYTFSAYATGGLETQLQAWLCVTTTWLALRLMRGPGAGPAAVVGFSLLTAAALLTRLDSAVYLFVLFPAAFFSLLGRSATGRERWLQAARLCLAPLAIVGLWLIWKLAYYGDVLPNTFYVKAGSVGSLSWGLAYCAAFVRSYWLIPVMLVALLAARRIFCDRESGIRLVVLTTIVWCLYVIKVGGDFMEFRFFVPVLPLFFVLVTWLLLRFLRQRELQQTFVVLILFGSLYHAREFYGDDVVESIGRLHGHVKDPKENWEQVGKVLGDLFPGEDCDVVLATTAAGAIPYYSRLETVDMLGLNDAWIARHGVAVPGRPGHQKMAPLDYLVRRKVNLDIGHPMIAPRNRASGVASREKSTGQNSRQETTGERPSGTPKMLEIPLSDDYKITVLYLVQNDCVDAVIREHKLKTYPAAGR